MAGALGAGVETARGLVDAFNSDRLRAPTDVVVTLTRDVLARTPDTDAYEVWMGMTRHAGRAPIALPDPLRDDLTRTALRNVEAATTLQSASHGLLDTSTHIPPTVHRVRSPGVDAADRAVTIRPRYPVGPRR
jgi:CBS domain-containing protein